MSSATAASENPQAGMGRPLPKKEADLFRNVVKHYEMKQYKKAIKQADTILKKFPKHGETLCMKGLTLNYTAKKEEALSFVKLGLMNDMRSHVCWHVYGLLYRSDRDYLEAIKAYKQALKIDPENLQILRDLSMLQIQMRDLSGFQVTRNTILTLKPNGKINWMAFALAKHMLGDLEDAVKVIDIYLGTLTEGSPELGRCFEAGELAMYRNMILAEIPDNYRQALNHLAVCEGIVLDRGAWLMTRGEYQLKLKDFVAARQSALLMFQRGMTENHKAHSMYMCAVLELQDEAVCDEALKLAGTNTLASMLPLTDEQTKTISEAYQSELVPHYLHSHAVQRIPYQLLKGEELGKALDIRCRKDLTKGVPSLCSELISYVKVVRKGRYVQPDDPFEVKSHPVFQMLAAMVEEYIVCLTSESKFSKEDEVEEAPSSLLWALYLRAGLHEHAGEYAEGIALLDKCLEHTPTAVDVYDIKSRLIKKSGDINAAVECIDKGRDLDRQDRYINNQTTKYMLQAGMEAEGLKRISLFTRHEGNAEQNLFDMQCSWYELELAACLSRKGEWGKSLKKYAAVVKHFDDFNEDQFDFHAYCLRKITLRAYVHVLRFEDKVYGEPYYCEAAAGIIRIYLHLFENPSIDENAEPDYSNMNAAEKKKAKAIARKKKNVAAKKEAVEEEEKEKEAAIAANGENKKENQKGGKPAIVEEDPFGKELLKKDPLEEAKKYSSILASYAPKTLETWILQYDVSIRRKKPLMALQALHKARSIDPESCELFSRVVDFAGKMDSFAEATDVVRTVMKAETPQLLGGQSVAEFVKAAASNVRDNARMDLPTRIAVAKALVETKTSPVAEASAVIVKGGISSKKVTVETCRDALSALKTFGNESDGAVKQWIADVQGRFPLIANLS